MEWITGIKTVYEVRAKTYHRPGAWAWERVTGFDTPAEADAWLTAHIRANKLCPADFTIVPVETGYAVEA